VPFAVNVGAVATPLLLVVAVAVVNPPVNVPLAPLAVAVNVTVTPLSRLLLASLTVAARAVPKLAFTVALCAVPAVAVMVAAGPEEVKAFTVKVKLVLRMLLPDVPVTVMV
jgi:hypothetical protein